MFNGSVYKAGFYQLTPMSSNHKGIVEDVFVTQAILKHIIKKSDVINKKGSSPVKVSMDGNDILIQLYSIIGIAHANKSLVC
jgi:hypothetical protein